jgi:hypothetical protein
MYVTLLNYGSENYYTIQKKKHCSLSDFATGSGVREIVIGLPEKCPFPPSFYSVSTDGPFPGFKAAGKGNKD